MKLTYFLIIILIPLNYAFTQNDNCPSLVTYEGKEYNTVQIGTQCWLKENLDIGIMIEGSSDQANNGTIEKYCYDNNPANCDTFGGLYQWNEAMQYTTAMGTQGICPAGWHIPTSAEFEMLGGDANALKEAGQGSGKGAGTNTLGFSGLLAGFRYENGSFGRVSRTAGFWCSNDLPDAGNANLLYLFYGINNIALSSNNKVQGFSIRCVRD